MVSSHLVRNVHYLCIIPARLSAPSPTSLRALAHLSGGAALVSALFAASLSLGMVSTPEWEVVRSGGCKVIFVDFF